jgi:hypothetical protein
LTLYQKVVYDIAMIRMGLLLAAAAALSCCSRSNNLLFGEVEAQMGAHTVRVTDCYRTTVAPPERLPDVNGQPSYRFMPCRDADVQIRTGELVVNGRSYGHIGDADTVLVDHGVVSVKPPELRAHGGK